MKHPFDVTRKLLVISIIVLFGSIYFLAIELPKSLDSKKERLTQVVDTSEDTPKEYDECATASDCAIGIQPDSCCGCPRAINKMMLGVDGWEQYMGNKNYSLNRQNKCQTFMACKTCELPSKQVGCQRGRCVFQGAIKY